MNKFHSLLFFSIFVVDLFSILHLMRIDLLTCIAEFEILMAKYWPSELLIFGKDSDVNSYDGR